MELRHGTPSIATRYATSLQTPSAALLGRALATLGIAPTKNAIANLVIAPPWTASSPYQGRTIVVPSSLPPRSFLRKPRRKRRWCCIGTERVRRKTLSYPTMGDAERRNFSLPSLANSQVVRHKFPFTLRSSWQISTEFFCQIDRIGYLCGK